GDVVVRVGGEAVVQEDVDPGRARGAGQVGRAAEEGDVAAVVADRRVHVRQGEQGVDRRVFVAGRRRVAGPVVDPEVLLVGGRVVRVGVEEVDVVHLHAVAAGGDQVHEVVVEAGIGDPLAVGRDHRVGQDVVGAQAAAGGTGLLVRAVDGMADEADGR